MGKYKAFSLLARKVGTRPGQDSRVFPKLDCRRRATRFSGVSAIEIADLVITR